MPEFSSSIEYPKNINTSTHRPRLSGFLSPYGMKKAGAPPHGLPSGKN